MARAETGRFRVPTDQNKWRPEEDFTLMMLVGKYTYAQIALRLGRSKAAVQRRASRNGYSARSEWSGDRETRTGLSEARRSKILTAPEEELSAYVPDCIEEPVLPHAGDRTYHREYKRKQRAKEATCDD